MYIWTMHNIQKNTSDRWNFAVLRRQDYRNNVAVNSGSFGMVLDTLA